MRAWSPSRRVAPVSRHCRRAAVSHDGARWLPAVLDGSRPRRRRPGRPRRRRRHRRASDDSADLLATRLGAATRPGRDRCSTRPRPTATAAVRRRWSAAGARRSTTSGSGCCTTTATPPPPRSPSCSPPRPTHPDADVLGPKLREWPSLRRLLEVGVTITGTGRRETGLERGEYDQGQHDDVREVLAVNTAGMLVRRDVLEALGGFDEQLPVFGNDIDFGWRAARAGHRTLVVPQAVVFHAEAAHRGVRRTPLTGRHTHYQERRGRAVHAAGQRVRPRSCRSSVVRLALRHPAAGARLPAGPLGRARRSTSSRPLSRSTAARGQLLRGPARARRGVAAAEPDRTYAACSRRAWLPYRHGLDFVSDLAAGRDQPGRRRGRAAAARAKARRGARPRRPGAAPRRRDRRRRGRYLTDTGLVARFLTNPVALGSRLFVVAVRWSAPARPSASIAGGALSPAPAAAGDWWRPARRDLARRSALGTDVPAPAYVLPLAPWPPRSCWQHRRRRVSAAACWPCRSRCGAPGGCSGSSAASSTRSALPRWLVRLGRRDLCPRAARRRGAWGEGRFGAGRRRGPLLPWLAHAALGFVDPERDRRWRAAWRTGLLLALVAAFAPGVWLFALLAHRGRARRSALVFARGLSRPRRSGVRRWWRSPSCPGAAGAVVAARCSLTGGRGGLLLDAGRLTVDQVDRFGDLLLGRLDDLGAPGWLGLAVLARARARRPAAAPHSRVAVVLCWLVALVAAVIAAAARPTPTWPWSAARPGLGAAAGRLQGASSSPRCSAPWRCLRRRRRAHPWRRAAWPTVPGRGRRAGAGRGLPCGSPRAGTAP